LLRPGGVIVEGTAGNTGIGLALVGNARGYRTVIVMPETQSQEKKDMLRLCGADLRLVPDAPFTNPNNYVRYSERLAVEIAMQEPNGAILANQFDNLANRRGHYETTGREIWEQTGGRITHFVAGLGTSGTFMGTTRRLKELHPRIRCVSVQPDSGFHGLEGLKHMPTAMVPGIYDPKLADENIEVRTEDAQESAKRLAREEGILTGASAGAALWASLEIARRLPKNERAVIVTIFADSGERYLSERFWSES